MSKIDTLSVHALLALHRSSINESIKDVAEHEILRRFDMIEDDLAEMKSKLCSCCKHESFKSLYCAPCQNDCGKTAARWELDDTKLVKDERMKVLDKMYEKALRNPLVTYHFHLDDKMSMSINYDKLWEKINNVKAQRYKDKK